MVFFSACIFATLANIDALTVGISYGIKRIKIDWKSNLLIAIIGVIGTAISLYLGNIVLNVVSSDLPRIIGAVMLILIGVWPIIKLIILKKRNKEKEDIYTCPEKYDKDKSGVLELKETIVLGTVLSVNNFALGVGFGIIGVNILLTIMLTFLLSIGFIHIGQLLRKRNKPKILEKHTEYISSALIILLGILTLFFDFI